MTCPVPQREMNESDLPTWVITVLLMGHDVLVRAVDVTDCAVSNKCILSVKLQFGKTLQQTLEADGALFLDNVGEPHEQAGQVEVHGRQSSFRFWFA